MRMRTALALLVSTAAVARADDWPQWMGPKRDNVWREDGLLDKFPKGGPKAVWRAPVNMGYAGPAVANGKVFGSDFTPAGQLDEGNFQRKAYGGTESVFALDAASGSELWKHSYPVEYGISYPHGPRCTPTVHDGKVYFLGAVGHLVCCDAEKGTILWKKDLVAEYKTKPALWGYAGHPLIDGKKLITLVGGEGSHVVAFDKDTGKELWKAETQAEQGYVPPSIIEAGGTRQLLAVGPKAVRSLDPETGKRYWSVPYDATSGSIISTPIKSGDLLLVSGYSDKNLLLKLAADKPEATEVWRDKKKAAIAPINVQPILDGGVIYGFDQDGRLYAVEPATGKRLWDTTDVVGGAAPSATAFIVKQGDRFWFFTERGDLVIGKLSLAGYEEVSRAHVIEPTRTAFGRKVVWCMPAFANKRMYVRNDKEMICVDLAK